MIGIDTSVILHAVNYTSPQHEKLIFWINKTKGHLATTHVNIAESLRLLTHPRVFEHPLALPEAVIIIDLFLEKLDVSVLENKPLWWRDLKDLQKNFPTLKGNHIFDAQIALCFQEHGVSDIVTWDSDFLKYPFLNIIKI